ncbi:MAG: virulence factor SrfB, partial [Rhodospirillum sp.]|nr:virulence factor SrfB [Rhodospirillum sp.]
NAPGNRAYRARSEEPRQLRTVILTLPSATPVAEQRVMKRLAKQAVDLLWKVMDWEDGNPIRLKPRLKVDWDEATTTHLVYLYNEITQKLQSSPRDFFSIMGRESPDGHPALRIASMDMGGGTTDLMVIEHEVVDNDRTILPRQLFREGFRLAGDDILKQIIEALILPSIGEAMAMAGVADPNILLSELFGGDREGMAQQERQRRSLFVNHVLKPAALMLINHYETDYARGVDRALSFTLGDVLGQGGTLIGAPVREFLEDAAKRKAAQGFHLEAVAIRSTTKRLEATVRGVVAAMLTDLCDVVRAYDCDVLLLSGRPSTMPVIQDFIFGLMPLPVHRVIPMSGYDIGNWYPFHSPTFRIEDPKTTAAVGAILCQVGEGRIEGMLVRSSEIRMRSTARFIGVQERNDQILDNKLVFSDIDLDQATGDTAHSVALTPPAFIGYRQLPLERWKTTPLYFLGFRDSRFAAEYAMPLTVTLARDGNTPEDGEDAMEDFEIQDAVDRNGETCGDKLKLTFQTLRVEREQEAGYWLDSGVLKVGRE